MNIAEYLAAFPTLRFGIVFFFGINIWKVKLQLDLLVSLGNCCADIILVM